MDEQTKQELLVIAEVLQKNAMAEADAAKLYTEQLRVINAAKGKLAGTTPDIIDYLNFLISATEEKISDELNHSRSLLDEYVEITGIQIAED